MAGVMRLECPGSNWIRLVNVNRLVLPCSAMKVRYRRVGSSFAIVGVMQGMPPWMAAAMVTIASGALSWSSQGVYRINAGKN